jgi:aminobenzoyl-glutamate utilization protein B
MMRARFAVVAGLTLALSARPAFAQENARLTAQKADAVRGVDELAKMAQEMVDSVFSFGELGFQEFETSKYLTGLLEQQGFKIQRGVSGMPTAWVATWGSGKPVIALGSDIDGIPQASQKPGVAYPDPIIAGAPGHGEGHNTGMPMQIVAAMAVKRIMERDKLPGTLMLWPGIAEEQLASKAWYVRDGMFKDVDVTIFAHVGNNLGVSWGDGGGNGMVSIEYTFEGETAHSAGAPWRGRSALDAVELMSIGWNSRREHLPEETRIHYVITNGGDQPNVVPRNASVWYYFRENDQPHIQEMWDIGNKMAEGAALMTNTKWSSRILGAAYPQHMNKTVAEVVYENIKKVGLPTWSEADQALAKGLQKELGNPRQEGLATKLEDLRGPDKNEDNYGGGSDDIGDISWNVPVRRCATHRTFRLPGHNWSSAIASATPIAHSRRRRGREGDGHVGARPDDPSRLCSRRGTTSGPSRRRIGASSSRRIRPGHPPERGDPCEVPRADEEVLLRPDEVRDVSRAAGHPVSDAEARGIEAPVVRARAAGPPSRTLPPRSGSARRRSCR